MPKAHLIYNPAAGPLTPRFLVDDAVRELQDLGWQIQIRQTGSGNHITQLAAEAAARGLDAVFVAGGDGSLGKAAAGLVGSQTALGPLPTGTANVWAQEFGLPLLSWTHLGALKECARRLASGRVQSVDVGLCNEVPFLLWAGVGLDAFIVHSVEPRKRWQKYFGIAQYFLSALVSASRWKGIDLTIQTEDDSLSGRFLLAVMSNIRLYAGGLAKLSPDARLDDGSMELWLFSGNSLRDALRHVWDLWAGRHTRSEQVRHFAWHRLSLASAAELYVQLDGEPIRAAQSLHVQVKPRALRVLVPAGAPTSLFESRAAMHSAA